MIYIGADHRGYELKEKTKQWLLDWHYEYEDCGAKEFDQDDDYPDIARPVADRVVTSANSMGILICGSGIGVCIAANKIKGSRAGTVATPEQVKASVNDEALNILCLSADYTSESVNQDIIKTFLETKFSGEERHVRRIEKIKQLENA